MLQRHTTLIIMLQYNIYVIQSLFIDVTITVVGNKKCAM